MLTLKNFYFLIPSQVSHWRGFYNTIIAFKPLVHREDNKIFSNLNIARFQLIFIINLGPEAAQVEIEQQLFQHPGSMLDPQWDTNHDRRPFPRRQLGCIRHRQKFRFHGELETNFPWQQNIYVGFTVSSFFSRKYPCQC